MAQLKYCDKHNQVGFLFKPTESAGYTEIVDFLRRSKLRYALTHNPPVYDSLVKQFWQTATARTLADGTQQLNATIDTIEYTITEESVRRQLQLADASGIHMLQNEEIFAGLQNIGYVNDRTFTFWKSHFTPQWRFLIHHILHCLSSKSGGWDQFGSNIAIALICLSTGRDFNFSKLIFDGMISNLKSKSKFLMYPRFLQMILNVQTENKNLFVPVSLTKKIFGNMKRGFQGIHRPLLPVMLTIDAGQPQPSADPTPSQSIPATSSSHVQIPQPPPTVTHSVQPPPQPSSVQPTAITPPTQPVQTTSPPPVSSIPDIQPTQPPSPQIPSPSFHDTEGPSFEPSYHMSPPPSHEPEIQASISSEESEQLRNLMDIVPRLESRVKSLEKELSETKQTLGTAILQLIEKVKKLENQVEEEGKSKRNKDERGQGSRSSLKQIKLQKGLGSQAPLRLASLQMKNQSLQNMPTKILHFEETDSAHVKYCSRQKKRVQRRKGNGKEPMMKKDIPAEVSCIKDIKRLQELADFRGKAKRCKLKWMLRTQRQIDLDASSLDDCMINADQILAERSTRKKGSNILLRKEQHAELKSKSFEEIQVLYERYKKQDQTFVAIGSEEDERAIKRINEKDADKEEEKKDEYVHEEVQEEGRKQRKEQVGTRQEVKSKKEKAWLYYIPLLNGNIFLTTKPQHDQTKPDEDIYLNKVTRSNGHQRFFRTLMGVLSILDREDLKVIYELVMEEYKDRLPEGFDRMLWGDLMIMFNQCDTADFWDTQHDYYPLDKGKSLTNVVTDVKITEEESSMDFRVIRVNTPWESDENRLKLYVLMYNIVKVADTRVKD
ncbi:hypothetical protein Tco_1377729 [Tanacetum coccineum]